MAEAITPEGLTKLKSELEELETVARRQIADRILSARQHGDLSENAEYHAAKEDQAHLETKIARLTERLRNASVVEADSTAGVVVFGMTVQVVDEQSGREASYTIVGPTEADLGAGKLSSESPVAQALMGAAPGDVVEVSTPSGGRRLRVDRLGV
jgi:transcription elongation factor GreA